MIYVLRTDSKETFYKVGYTKREMKKRITALQTGCPYRLELVKTMQGSQEKEKEMHSLLVHSRVHGEWYKDDFFTREVLGIYDFKAFPAREFEPSKKQEFIIELMKKTEGQEFWALGTFLKTFEVTEDELRTIPYGKRGFGIHLLDYEVVSGVGKFHGEPYKGKLLCIGSR